MASRKASSRGGSAKGMSRTRMPGQGVRPTSTKHVGTQLKSKSVKLPPADRRKPTATHRAY